jgi:hypothetical protein
MTARRQAWDDYTSHHPFQPTENKRPTPIGNPNPRRRRAILTSARKAMPSNAPASPPRDLCTSPHQPEPPIRLPIPAPSQPARSKKHAPAPNQSLHQIAPSWLWHFWNSMITNPLLASLVQKTPSQPPKTACTKTPSFAQSCPPSPHPPTAAHPPAPRYNQKHGQAPRAAPPPRRGRTRRWR